MDLTSLSSSLQALQAHFSQEFGDVALAREFADIVISDVLQWRPPVVAPADVQTIVAYTFGNRIDANGNRSPGPVNEALANVAVRLHEETCAPVYAQWEIAEGIGDRIGAEHLFSITPKRNARAETLYLSTGGVAAAVIARIRDAERLGKVAVVGFADHIKRCVDSSRRVGMCGRVTSGSVEQPGGATRAACKSTVSPGPTSRGRRVRAPSKYTICFLSSLSQW